MTSVMELDDVDAVSFDFFDTLGRLRDGRGRGRQLMEYFAASGLESDPWDHQHLYEVFRPDPANALADPSSAGRRAYIVDLVTRLFERLNVRGPRSAAAAHAEDVWELLGPQSFAVFPEVPHVLRQLREAGIPVAIVSNWPCGLSHFCDHLGIASQVDHILCSAELGVSKPDRRIFEEACRRLGTAAGRTLHVGDSVVDDFKGALEAGLKALLVQRSPVDGALAEGSIQGLDEVPRLMGVPRT
jgi:HAD superfamily hydrolase (TIGR01549 family)